jgi:hypothetical protein
LVLVAIGHNRPKVWDPRSPRNKLNYLQGFSFLE